MTAVKQRSGRFHQSLFRRKSLSDSRIIAELYIMYYPSKVCENIGNIGDVSNTISLLRIDLP